MRKSDRLPEGHPHHQHKFNPANVARLENPARRDLFPLGATLDRITLPAAPVILDVGTGSGFFLADLRERAGPAGRVIGCDSSPEMFEIVCRKVQGNGWENVEILLSEEALVPLPPASVDLACLFFVFHELAEAGATLAELRRITRPGGHLWIVDWNKGPREMGPPPNEVPSLADIARLVGAAGWKIEESGEPSRFCVQLLAQPKP
jgi:ubiquinone/menaquinone biosynthesis C-methylase UbiE